MKRTTNLNTVGSIIRVVDTYPKAQRVHQILTDLNVPHRTMTKPSQRYPGMTMYAICSDGFFLTSDDIGVINRIIDGSIGQMNADPRLIVTTESNKRS